MKLKKRGCPSAPGLIAYEDGVMDVARRAVVQSHLRECATCRKRLRDSEDIGHLVRASTRLIDNADARAQLKLRMHAEHHQTSSTSSITDTRYPHLQHAHRWAVAGLTLLGLLGLGLVSSQSIEGGSSFTRWWREERSSEQLVQSDRFQDAPAGAPTTVAELATLPFGLAKTTDGRTNNGHVEHFYRNTQGLAIRVTIDPPERGWIAPVDDDDNRELVRFRDHDVLVMQGSEPDTAVAMFWVQDDHLYTVTVLEAPNGGLSRPAAFTLAGAIMDTVP